MCYVPTTRISGDPVKIADLSRVPVWTWVWPLIAALVLVVHFVFHPGTPFLVVEAIALIATVFAAVHHAEVVAQTVGEPLGTLVLSLAVTIIEVSLIVSIMLTHDEANAVLARDTVFAVVMIVCNGIVGFCLLAGGVLHREQDFQLQGTNAALSVLIALTTLTLILPNVTVATSGPSFSSAQLVFAAIVSAILYFGFLFVQTVRHREYFLAPGGGTGEAAVESAPRKVVALSSGLLLVALASVVLLAESLEPALEHGLVAVRAPKSFVGVVIASVVLMPEGLASFRAARANRLQTSINLALGSALATIGLTIPTVAALSLLLHQPLTLGLNPEQTVLLVLTLVISVLTLGTGRTSVLQGIVLLTLFAVFLFLSILP
jgi:Ca2+:H+ antiporter